MSTDECATAQDGNLLARFRSLVGAAHVIADSQAIACAETATFATDGQHVRGIVRPGNTEQVQQCVQCANQLDVALYPISRGRNWGYGSRVPPRGNAVVLDLSRMDRITELDPELALVTVEPGVTMEQLADCLDEQAPELMLNVGGGPPDGSVIGNTVERGRGIGPYVGPLRPVTDLQVVLPTGERVHTGLARFEQAQNAGAVAYAPGPDTRGLFLQSNLGIVTRATLPLARRPRDFRLMLLWLSEEEDLERIVDPLRELMLDQVIPPMFSFHNHYKLLSWQTDDVAGGGGDGAPLSRDEARRRAGRAWQGVVPVMSPDSALGRRRVQILRKALRSYARRILVLGPAAQKALSAGQDAARSLGLLKGPSRLDPQLFLGRPTRFALRHAYYKRPRSRPSDLDYDPDRDRCGLVWLCPFPATRRAAVGEVRRHLESVALEYQFEPCISVQAWTERSILLLLSLVYDRDVPGADERALRCAHRLHGELARRGYFVYRLPIFAMETLPNPSDDWGVFISKLKRSLDPKDILSPGRYDFRNWWTRNDTE